MQAGVLDSSNDKNEIVHDTVADILVPSLEETQDAIVKYDVQKHDLLLVGIEPASLQDVELKYSLSGILGRSWIQESYPSNVLSFC